MSTVPLDLQQLRIVESLKIASAPPSPVSWAPRFDGPIGPQSPDPGGAFWEDLRDLLPASHQDLANVLQASSMGLAGNLPGGLAELWNRMSPADMQAAAAAFQQQNPAALESLGQQFQSAGTGFVNSAAQGCFSEGGLSDFINSGAIAESLLSAGLAFLPPEARKAAAVGMALLKGNPADILGALSAYLPEELKPVMAVGMGVLSGGIAGGVGALIGQFLPPELQAAWGAFMKTGLLNDALKAMFPPAGTSSAPTGAVAGSFPPWAARLGDHRECPGGKGKIIAPCAPNVYIGNLPAARQGDAAACTKGVPDMIEKGEPSVKICGMPAARILDPTVHCGIITSGFPRVLIGKSAAGSSKCMVVAQGAGSGLVSGLGG